METEELITKVTQTITREDGSQARIVVQDLTPLRTTKSLDVYVHRRNGVDDEWILCSNTPHPDWKTMSIDDYVKFGRSEQHQTVSHGEVMKLSMAIGKPISYLN